MKWLFYAALYVIIWLIVRKALLKIVEIWKNKRNNRQN